MSINENSILIFGAGKIGRSFIGQLFSLSGYQVVFSDIDLKIVQALNERKSYPVIIKDKKEEKILVKNVRAVSGLDQTAVIKEVEQASILAVSVGKNALEKIIPLIGKGLIKRYKSNPNLPFDIIIAENMRSASDFIREKLLKILPGDYPFEQLVGLVETSIGKMVPIMSQDDLKDDPLMVFAESYNSLIVDKKGFRGPVPEVKGLSPKGNIKAWVDRKLFIHNLGHATAAYFGYYKHPKATYIYEVLSDNEVYRFTKNVMLQASTILHAEYPDEFSIIDLKIHVEDLLSRFQNEALKDTVFRVGQDRLRKLGPQDRFMGIIRLDKKNKMVHDNIIRAMVFAFFFHAEDENGNENLTDLLFDNYKLKGIKYTLHQVCRINPMWDIYLKRDFEKQYNELKKYMIGCLRYYAY